MKPIIKAISISTKKHTKKGNKKSAHLVADQGVQGDAHAEGGIRQVSLLAWESIQKMLKSGADVKPGDLGENITTQGIDLLSLMIGARLKIGEDAVLEVTQKGKECSQPCPIFYQVGNCVMPKEGIFARVIKGGTIKVMDPINIQLEEQ